MKCYNAVPSRFEDGRHLRIGAGLEAAGFEVTDKPAPYAATWNLHTGAARNAFQHADTTFVFEEAYTRYLSPVKAFAMAINGHNGAGWHRTGRGRFEKFEIELKPWRKDGDHILVCLSRGMGSPQMAQPRDWGVQILAQLKAVTSRPIYIRGHPGKHKDKAPFLADELEGAHCVVTWGSNCGVAALAAGVPVFYCGPAIMTSPAAWALAAADIEKPWRALRRETFERLAWAQWTPDEIESGLPFKWNIRTL